MPLAPSFDTVGWFARSMDVFERVGAVLLGEDKSGPALRRAIVADDAFAQLFGEAEARALAPTVRSVERRLGPASHVRLAPNGLVAWQQLYRVLQGYEAWAIHGPWITSRDAGLGPQTKVRFDVSSKVTADEADKARDERAAAATRIREVVGDDGVLVIPSMPGIALKVDAPEPEFEAFRARAISLMCSAGIAGLPQVSLPLAKVEGCPLGLSLIGPAGRDRALLELGRAVLAA